MMSWNPRRRKDPKPDPRVAAFEREVNNRDLFEAALALVIAYSRDSLECPVCHERSSTATGWNRHQSVEATRNYFKCSQCQAAFFRDSDVLTSCAVAAASVLDRCMMYSTLEACEGADEMFFDLDEES
jgi:hypothetical protein